MEHEFKAMLGIHKLDHLDLFDKDTQALLKRYYPNLQMNIKQMGEHIPSLHAYIDQHVKITITLNGNTVERLATHVNNELLISMMKELDPL